MLVELFGTRLGEKEAAFRIGAEVLGCMAKWGDGWIECKGHERTEGKSRMPARHRFHQMARCHALPPYR